ncbi:pilin assembly protein [Neisseria arctica]|uniref:Pilin assembly protein n=1 Tax=Neisseria arctica TaxID=1470200 RepID=A0A0J0YSN5_9NEIS|nr:pilus assembly protein PilP [Neisseria arctica]KLT73175.1 pilin assembly protein [Neisseria arctica]UOO87092.1 pilus assembly protein PilP [Neisseria arctica]
MKIKLLLPCFIILTACSPKHEDLHQWMEDTQKQAKASIRPFEAPTVNPPQPYNPPTYTGLNAFDSKRLNAANQGTNAPNTNRPKEVLEAFSLENLRYVGRLTKNGSTSGFVEADGHVYTVRPGNYIGQNFGKIQSIREDKITIVEVVEDTYGNWTFRNAELPLSSTSDNNANQTNN